MTLYYTLVFLLLVAEMALFMLLIVPLPFTVRRKMFTYELLTPATRLARALSYLDSMLTDGPTASSRRTR
jgi:hypothetical protein